MDDLSLPSGSNENRSPERLIDLRVRSERLDPVRLSTWTKLPGHSEAQEVRLSRTVHLRESAVPHQAPTPPEEQNPIPKIQKIGHIPLRSETLPAPEITISSTKSSPQISPVIAEFRRQIKERILMNLKLPSTPQKSVTAKSPRRFGLNWKETLKFVATSAAIFFITLVAINFQSYYQMVEAVLNPERIALLGRELGNLTEPAIKTHRTPLLPIAGIERKVTSKVPSIYAIKPDQNRLIIPKLGQNVPIIDGVGMDALLAENWKQLEDSIQEGLQHGVVHYPGTANPGQNGNVFITGHSSYYPWDPGRYKSVFALLDKLEVGDEYTVLWKGNEYRYKIIEEKLVKPEDTSVLDQPSDKERSTLMTCYPVGTTSSRLIYVAERI